MNPYDPILLHIARLAASHVRARLVRLFTGTSIRGTRGNTVVLGTALLHGCKITFSGKGNRLKIEDGARLWGAHIQFIGDGNILYIGRDARLRGDCDLLLEDGGSWIYIGAQTTMTRTQLIASEGRNIRFGQDCMVAAGTVVRTSDSHSILDARGVRTNPAMHVTIGDHVWIGLRALVMKGVQIGSGAIVAAGSVVTRDVRGRDLAAGIPARTVRRNVDWKRERIAQTPTP
jgi:acetyltransferase-like isoleucine patch superfamily enzyme